MRAPVLIEGIARQSATRRSSSVAPNDRLAIRALIPRSTLVALEGAVERRDQQAGVEAPDLFRVRSRSQNNRAQSPNSPRKIGASGACGQNLFRRRGVLIELLRFDLPGRKQRRHVLERAQRARRTSLPPRPAAARLSDSSRSGPLKRDRDEIVPHHLTYSRHCSESQELE
jgi:hypothetical protein